MFHDLLDASCEHYAARVALRYQGRDCTYSELQQRSLALAAGLARLGIARGDRIVMYLQNRPEVVEIALACSRLGAIFVPINPMLKQRQLLYTLQNCGARVLVASQSSAVLGSDLMSACPELRTMVICDVPKGEAVGRAAAVVYEDLLTGSSGPLPSLLAIDRDPAAILYTSGSTGRPKGVVISHRNLVSGAHSVSSYLGNTLEDRLLAALPLSFDYGFSQVSTAFATGACAVISRFSTAPALIDEVTEEAITGLAGVPTMWVHLGVAEWPAEAVQRLRYLTNSGGALLMPTIRALQAKLPNTRIFCMYGLTEAFRSTYLDPAELERRPGSIGKAIPNQEILVLRPDGSRCDPGEIGELVHRGSLVSLGYWNDAEATRLRFRPVPSAVAGVMCEEIGVWSGDRVRADEEGFLYFVGREDHLIKTSGYRISPNEIEEIVAEVAGVREAIALGIPDSVLGHRILVAVVPAERSATLADRVRQHCRMQMPPYMVPDEIHVVDRIPRTAHEKHDRAALAEMLASLRAESARVAGA